MAIDYTPSDDIVPDAPTPTTSEIAMMSRVEKILRHTPEPPVKPEEADRKMAAGLSMSLVLAVLAGALWLWCSGWRLAGTGAVAPPGMDTVLSGLDNVRSLYVVDSLVSPLTEDTLAVLQTRFPQVAIRIITGSNSPLAGDKRATVVPDEGLKTPGVLLNGTLWQPAR